jgi:cell wall-associated NlpC family hydrolase
LESSDTLGERAAALAHEIFEQATMVRYEHKHRPAAEQVASGSEGEEVRTDCSGFVSYIIHRVARRHYAAVRSLQPAAPYPQAKTWARFFCSLNAGYPQNGWLRVAAYQDLRRGDFIAWTKAKNAEDHAGHGNTGHVMMVYGEPGAVQQESINGETIRFVNVPVIDASSVYHFPPEQLPPLAHQQHRDGLGMGCVRILISPSGEPIGYWEGSYWGEGGKPIKEPHMSSEIGFARMVHLRD